MLVVHYTKNNKKIENNMQTGNINYIYKNDLDKACFQHDLTYGSYNDLAKRRQSDKVLRDKDFKNASNAKYDGYQRGLTSKIYKFFDKKSKGSGAMANQQLANQLQKPIIKKLKKEEFTLRLNTMFGV